MLAFAGSVADFALASNPEGVLEDVMSLALVRAGVGPALFRKGTVYRTLNRRPSLWHTILSPTGIGYIRTMVDWCAPIDYDGSHAI